MTDATEAAGDERANSVSCIGLIRTATGLRHGLFPT